MWSIWRSTRQGGSAAGVLAEAGLSSTPHRSAVPGEHGRVRDEHGRLCRLRDQIYCYRSPKTNTVYLGRVESGAERRLFTPLLEDKSFDIEATGLIYVGRVISAI